MGMRALPLIGETGGKMAVPGDILSNVPLASAPCIQQLHLPSYHYVCKQFEALLSR